MLFIAWLAVFRDLTWRRGLTILLTIGLTSALVFAPLGYYFLQSPFLFFDRTAQASLFSPASETPSKFLTLVSNIADNFGMFTFRGDANWRHNYPFRPVFDPISSVFFVCGLLYALYRIRRREFAFLTLWLLVMFLPGMLSTESPYYLRILPLAPVTYIFFAFGLVEVGTFLFLRAERLRLPPRRIKQAYGLAVAGLMVSTAIIAFHDYFQVWALDPRVFAAYDGGITDSAKYLNTVEGEPLVMAASTRLMPHFTVTFLSRPFADERWYDDRQSLVIPLAYRPRPDFAGTLSSTSSSRRSALFILLNPQSPWLPVLGRVFPQGKVAATGHRPDGEVSFTAYSVPDVTDLAVPLEPQFPLEVRLGDDAQTLGYDLEGPELTNGHPTIQAGQTLNFTLYWRPLRPVNKRDEHRIFVHLLDAKLRGGWGQFDNGGYPISQWHGDELVLSRFGIRVPDNAPSGKYNLILGNYDYLAGDRLKVFSESGQDIGDFIALPPLKVKGHDAMSPRPQSQITALFGDQARLIGYDLPGNVADGLSVRVLPKEDSKLGVTLYWQGAKPMKDDYTVFVQLLDPSGKLASQSDGQPAGGAFPTSFWDEGDFVTDFHGLPLPTTLAPGQYKLIAGMYLLTTGERLRSEGGADAADLGTITVD